MHCRVCDGTKLDLALDLGSQPWGNHFLTSEERGTEPFYPLRLLFCHECHTSQLDYTVRKEVMFSNHTYLSGITRSLSQHFANLAHAIDTSFFAKRHSKSALDIGSNDGTQLQHYQALGYDVLGVESSSRIVEIARSKGVKTTHAFFNEACARDIGQKFDVINASGVFFHLEELHSATRGVKLLLAEGGVFVVQFLYMKSIMENGAFDQIYHEHLLFYTLETLQKLLTPYDLMVFDAHFSSIHGGSMIAYVTHTGEREKTDRLVKLEEEEAQAGTNTFGAYLSFAKRITELKRENVAYLQQKKEEGKTIFGMGAPVKGNTLLNTFGIGKNFLACLVEKNPLRKGLFSPGQHLPIVLEESLERPPDVYYVLAWNFKREILKNNAHLLAQGVEFYFPINPKEL